MWRPFVQIGHSRIFVVAYMHVCEYADGTIKKYNIQLIWFKGRTKLFWAKVKEGLNVVEFTSSGSDGEGVQRRRGRGTEPDSESPLLLAEACVDCWLTALVSKACVNWKVNSSGMWRKTHCMSVVVFTQILGGDVNESSTIASRSSD